MKPRADAARSHSAGRAVSRETSSATNVRERTTPSAEETARIGAPSVEDLLGDAYPRLRIFAQLLASDGVERGLIGPREATGLWERHILNSAAVAPHLPARGTMIDLGSGAGLPGVVLACMRPDLRTVLLEPMERRVRWLHQVIDVLGLDSVEVVRARAQELHGQLAVQVVTARAVAPLERLVGWALPLLAVGGELLAIKGRMAATEVATAEAVIERLGGGPAEIIRAGITAGVPPTTVVRVVMRRREPEPVARRQRIGR